MSKHESVRLQNVEESSTLAMALIGSISAISSVVILDSNILSISS